MSEVMEYLGGSIARNEKEERLAQAERDAAETERIQSEARVCAAQMLVDGLTHLSDRLDNFEARKQERAEQARRAKEEAEVARIEAELNALPDPDNPNAVGDDGELEAVKHPPDKQQYDPEGEYTEGDALTGLTPEVLEKDTPPPLGNYGAPLPPESPYRTPTAIGGN
jgi:hypothetical protein